MNSLSDTSTFSDCLLKWYNSHRRSLPWRVDNNPYSVWLSEIILQQTRVDQGIPYFLKVLKTFPDVQTLAAAPLEDVLKCWQGLGYYSRARNLHEAAKQVVSVHGGVFPDSYSGLITLKGVGEYTAAAIASIAFGEATAVLDGNVFRVLSRVFNLDTPIDSTAGKRQFRELANALLDKNRPADYNQGLMDFGALQCVPSNPDCPGCPFSTTCLAYAQKRVQDLPVKQPAKPKQNRFFTYLFLTDGTHTWIQQRTGTDIWKQLWEFPMIETGQALDATTLLQSGRLNTFVKGPLSVGTPYARKHILSHQLLNAVFIPVTVQTDAQIVVNATRISISDLHNYPTHRLMEHYISTIS